MSELASSVSTVEENMRACSLDDVDIGMRRVRKVITKNDEVDLPSVEVNPVREELYTKTCSKPLQSSTQSISDKAKGLFRNKQKNKKLKKSMDVRGSIKARLDYLQTLMCQTDYEKWRMALRQMIELYYTDADLHHFLDYLSAVFDRTILLKESNPTIDQEVPLYENDLPVLLDRKIVDWIDFWTGLNCGYEGPDSITNIRMCIVYVPPAVSIYVLRGFATILSSFNDMHINSIKHLLSTSDSEAQKLMESLKSLDVRSLPKSLLDQTWDLYSELYKNCGLEVIRRGHQRDYTYNPTPETVHFLVSIYTIIYVFHYAIDDR